MRKKLYLFILPFFLFSCPGLNDWRYKLPNDYEMWHINSSNITVGLAGKDNSSLSIYDGGILIGIPPHIIDFGHDEKYVCAKIITKESQGNEYFYYILDTQNRYIYEFSNENDFNEKMEELDIGIKIKNLKESIQTGEIKVEYPKLY